MISSPLELGNQICFPIYSVSRLITKTYTPYLNKIGLTYPQYLVMMVLWENDKLCINQITEKLLLDTNTLSPLLKRMEKMELIDRKRSSKDERSVIVELTTKGNELKKQAEPIPEKLLETVLNKTISIENINLLKNILNDWVTVLSDNKTEK
ncbi:MarR family transcriptional regulator [Flavobacterium sp.]|uniref:MarR family winged helix-turn-helix transcriptional regulator n=1 Tax=Flavobacterium sp. TaxID=239 RepID=UPI00286E51A1|nr:MarR family transcriptional regulator [Flavobacterium sp.]